MNIKELMILLLTAFGIAFGLLAGMGILEIIHIVLQHIGAL